MGEILSAWPGVPYPCLFETRAQRAHSFLIRWTSANFSFAYSHSTSLSVTMTLPFKKRKMTVPLTVKVNRLAKAVGRQRPDTQEWMIDTAVSSTTVGYNEELVDLIPTSVLGTVSGDFIVERVDYRVILDSVGSFARGRVDVIVPKKDSAIVSTGAVSSQEFYHDKNIKSYQSKLWLPSAASPFFGPEGTCKLGLVVKRDDFVITRNQPYLLLRWNSSSTASVNIKIHARVHYREK